MDMNFEQKIKQTLEQYTASESPTGWDALEKRLDQVMPVQKTGKGKAWLLGGLAFVVGALGLWYVFVGMPKNSATTAALETQAVEPMSNKEVSEQAPTVEPESASNKALQALDHTENHSASTQPISTSLPKTEDKKLEQQAVSDVPSDFLDKTPLPDPKKANPVVASKSEVKDQDFLFDIKYKKEACQGEVVTFSTTPSCPDCRYDWDLGDGKSYSNNSPTIQTAFDAPGVYHITLNVTLNGQTGSLKNAIVIHEKPREDIDFSVEQQESMPEYHFTYNQAKMYSVTWSFSDGQKLFGNNCKRMFYEKRQELISVKALSDKGCKAEFSQKINIDQPFTLLAPNSFSPNGDGKNDTWMPIVLQQNKMPFTLQIMDIATKTLVYTTSNPTQGWDGRIQGTSRNAKMGQSFVWVAQVKINGSETKTFQGEIIVVE